MSLGPGNAVYALLGYTLPVRDGQARGWAKSYVCYRVQFSMAGFGRSATVEFGGRD